MPSEIRRSDKKEQLTWNPGSAITLVASVAADPSCTPLQAVTYSTATGDHRKGTLLNLI